MSNEKLLEQLIKIKNCIEQNSIESLTVVEKLIDTITVEIGKKNAKDNGLCETYKSAQKILKWAKQGNKGRTILHSANVINGIQYVCDGYNLLKLNDWLDIPSTDKGCLSLDTILNGEKARTCSETKLPNIAELKTLITTKKVELAAEGVKKCDQIVRFTFEDGRLTVRAEYLLNMMLALPKAKCYLSKYAAYFVDDNIGEGIVMGIRYV